MKTIASLLLFLISTLAFCKVTIDSDKVKNISYVLASEKGIGKSSFGHAYMRFSYQDRLSDGDYIVEFIADVAIDDIDILRGAGIGKNYAFTTAVKKYSVVKKEHNIVENRDLITYVLNLSQEEKNKVIELVNDVIINGTTKEYAFFSENCATFVSGILNHVLKIKLSGINTIVPNRIPKLLHENELVIKETVDHSFQKKRINLYKDNTLLFDTSNIERLYLQNLKQQLSSTKLEVRFFGYYKLLAMRSKVSDGKWKGIYLFARKLLADEVYAVKNHFVGMFRNKKLNLNLIKLNKIKTSSRSKVKKVSLTQEDGIVKLKIKLKIKKSVNGRRSSRKTRYTNKFVNIKELSSENGKVIFLNNKQVALRLNEDLITDTYFDYKNHFNAEIINTEDGYFIQPLAFILENDANVEDDLSKSDYISFENGYKEKSFCYAYTDLIASQAQTVIYAPELAAVDHEHGIELIKAILKNKIVVVPGFKNLLEFTNSLNQDQLLSVLVDHQFSTHGPVDRALNSFSDTKITNKNHYLLSNLLEIGINPTLIFRVEGKNVAHSIVATKIVKNGSELVFEALDPNFGYTKNHFSLDLNTSKFKTSFYGKTDLYLPKINVSKIRFIADLLKQKLVRKRLKKLISSKNQYIFTIKDIIN